MQLSFFSKQEKSRPVLAGFLLKELQGVCFLYEKQQQGIAVLRHKVFQYSDGWNRITEDMNDALSPLETETKTYSAEVIYYLFSHVIEHSSKEIKKPYAEIIKKASHALELKPIGYIEVIDSIKEYLQREKDSALSALVVELDVSYGTIFLYKAGHCVSRVEVGRTDSLIADISEGLREVSQTHPVLPSVMYLYDSSDLSKESSDLLSHKWDVELFAQQPRIEVVNQQTVSDSLRSLFASQIYQEKTIQKEAGDNEQTERKVMGFSIGSDIFADQSMPEKERHSVVTSTRTDPTPTTSINESLIPSTSVRSGSAPSFALKKGLLIIFLLFFFVAMGIGVFELFIHKASITVYPVERTISQDFKEQLEVAEERTEKLTVVQRTVSETFTVQSSTTGKKDIGERASGSVTVYSYDEKEKSFGKGYILRIDDVEYELDDQIVVPASSFAGDGITKNPGKVKATIRSSGIGPQANKSKGQKFSLDNVSSSVYFAIADEAISGGTKKTIQTVAKDDIENLKKQITARAQKELSVDGQKGSTKTEFKVVEGVSEVTLSNLKQSAEIGEEATKVSLTARANLVGYFVDVTQLNAYIKQAITDKIDAGYMISSIQTGVLNGKKVEDAIQVAFEARIDTAEFIDKKQVQMLARGRSIPSLEETMRQKYPSSRVEVQITPSLVSLLPLLSSRIEVFTGNK